jgi:Tfp pilus assembly protein PilF
MGQNTVEKEKRIRRIPQDWSLVLILFLAILGAYYQALPYPFLNLDDHYYILDNPYIRDLSWKGLYKIFSTPIVDNYFPLQILSYALDFQIWHIQPFGYRFHNVILHILNAVLVYLLLKKFSSNTWVSFLAALLFGLHPVNVESVTWVAERKNVLSMAFMLLSFLSYIYYLEEQNQNWRRGFYLGALSLFLLALLAKVSAVVLPLLFLLFDLCFQRRKKGEMIRDKIPFLALAFLFSVITIWIYHSGKYLVHYHGGSPYSTFLAMVNVFVEYVIYLIVPYYLDHLYWTPIPGTIFERQVLLSLGSILLMSFLALRSFRKNRIFFFCLGWFFISLLPVLNIVPLVVLRADRYMYLPAIGFFYLVSWGLWKIVQREPRRFRFSIFLLGGLFLTSTYAFLTVERNQIWKDPVLFWEETLKKYPDSITSYKFIGYLYMERGRNDLAASYFRAGLERSPYEPTLLNGLAGVHIRKGDLKKAEELLRKANRVDPKDSDTYCNLGVLYYEKGDMDQGRFYLQKALEIDSKNAFAHVNLGVILYNRNQWEEAVREFERALESSPSSIEPYLNLALAYEQKGLWDKAESNLKRALDYAPDSYAVLSSLARISFEQGKILESKYYFREANRINPKDGETRKYLRLIAQREAKPSFQKATDLPPHSHQGSGRPE